MPTFKLLRLVKRSIKLLLQVFIIFEKHAKWKLQNEIQEILTSELKVFWTELEHVLTRLQNRKSKAKDNDRNIL